jgi:hypothetical protein
MLYVSVCIIDFQLSLDWIILPKLRDVICSSKWEKAMLAIMILILNWWQWIIAKVLILGEIDFILKVETTTL